MSLPEKLVPLLTETDGWAAGGPNLACREHLDIGDDQERTAESFASKWTMLDYHGADYDRLLASQKAWYLEKYGFRSDDEFGRFLSGNKTVLDAGTGNGMKAAWFSELIPDNLVVAAEISGSVEAAADNFRNQENLIFVRCDIGQMSFFKDEAFDYVNCDEVIHHTADPERTFKELVRVIRPGGQLSCYVYRRKAMPRELLDEHFRSYCKEIPEHELKSLAEQLTDLGRRLSEIEGEIDFPAIPALGIEGGRMTVQRFLYWNFLKCYWNPDVGFKNSVLINYDWYSPVQAQRFDEQEFRRWISKENLRIEHFHVEEACYCGRFTKPA